jgi:hypothetical protein
MFKRDVVFRSPRLEERLRPVCEEVLKRFDMPKTRLLCFLDDEDQPAMTNKIGRFYCGVFSTIRGNGLPMYCRQSTVMTSSFMYGVRPVRLSPAP